MTQMKIGTEEDGEDAEAGDEGGEPARYKQAPVGHIEDFGEKQLLKSRKDFDWNY